MASIGLTKRASEQSSCNPNPDLLPSLEARGFCPKRHNVQGLPLADPIFGFAWEAQRAGEYFGGSNLHWRWARLPVARTWVNRRRG
jgi:hypothetical protein